MGGYRAQPGGEAAQGVPQARLPPPQAAGAAPGSCTLQLPEKSKKGRTAAFFPGAAYPSSATMMELESRKPRSVSAMRSSPARSSPARCIGAARRSRAV